MLWLIYDIILKLFKLLISCFILSRYVWHNIVLVIVVVIILVVVVFVVAIVVIGKLTQEFIELYDHASLAVVALILTRHCRKASGPQFGRPWPGSLFGKAERSKDTR